MGDAQRLRLSPLASYAGRVIQLGQYPPPLMAIAHFSDPHLLAGDRFLYDAVDAEANLRQALAQLERSGEKVSAIVFTGDLADLGEPDAYRRLRVMVEWTAQRIGTRVVWVMGNHDERDRFQEELFDEAATGRPQDRVFDLDGLRVIALDTTVPGYHHGDITDDQFSWLEGQLSTAAPLGTVLALHHPPIPSPVDVMAILELRRQDRLAEVLAESDVRLILGGHLHYSTHSVFAGIPVSVASATCYTLDPSGPPATLLGVGGGQAFTLVHVYEDRTVHSIVPLGDYARVSGFDPPVLRAFEPMTPSERLEAFSSKSSTFSLADLEDPPA